MNGGPFIDIFEAAKEVNSRVVCYYHSNGNIESVIPDLIEIGIEILNPVQPECMDPLAIKKRYGEQLTLWGTIGTQRLMPFGSPEEVKTAVKTMIPIGPVITAAWWWLPPTSWNRRFPGKTSWPWLRGSTRSVPRVYGQS